MANGVDLRLLSSFEEGAGSRICRLPEDRRPRFAGIAGDAKAGSFTLAGRGAGAAALSEAALLLAAEGIALEEGVLGDNCISLRVAPEQAEAALRKLHEKLVLPGIA